MKSYALVLLLLTLAMTSQASLWRVNNNFGITANFTNPQSAHNAASNGDTIYIESSATGYSSVTCTKQLVWIGPGYFIDPTITGNNSGLQFHTNSAMVSTFFANAGSANSVFMGLTVSNFYISTNNITISRCLVSSIDFYATTANLTSNFTLNQCFVTGSIQPYYYNPGSNNSTGYAFTNNVIMGSLALTSNYLGVIVNSNYLYQLSTLSFVVSNNIIYSFGLPLFGVYASNVYNNLFLVTTNANYVGSNGNIFSASNPYSASNTIFASAAAGSNDSWTSLKAGSPAIGAGLNGIDIGPRGGPTPYKLSGIPNVPSIYQFLFRSTPSNTLPVTISTRSNSAN